MNSARAMVEDFLSPFTVPAVDFAESPPRAAWVEVDLDAFVRNIRLIRAQLPDRIRLLYVVKDDAYGLGAAVMSRLALENGVNQLAVYTIEEGIELRRAGINAPILILGERLPDELPWCIRFGLAPSLGTLETARVLDRMGRESGRVIPVHIKVNSGMNRFGFKWSDADKWSAELAGLDHLEWQGALSHFAQSDELDKTFAREQLGRFLGAVETLRAAGIDPKCLHMCNSGGFLDLPEAHLDMVRVGILALGVYPSLVCRRIEGISNVMSVKARITAVQTLDPGETVGYGMRWAATGRARVAIVPVGYGDGYPRVRNEGSVLLRGRPAPLVGGVTMDALMVDVSEFDPVVPGEEVVLMGRQGEGEISAREVAALKRSVTYDILVNWRSRLPRRYVRGAGT